MLWNALQLALREIRRNVLRSFLTILGIVIGVAAVIIMVTLGGGATAEVSRQIASLGTNLVMVIPGQLGHGRGSAPQFDDDDVHAIAHDIPGLSAVAPVATRTLTTVYGNTSWSSSITGTTNEYFTVGNWQFTSGRPFSDSELHGGKLVCIVGDTVRRQLFGNQDPVGSKIRIKNLSCEIIGLLQPKGQTAMGRDQDDVVIMPLRSFQRRVSGRLDVNMIQVSVQNSSDIDTTKTVLDALMRERRHLAANEDNNFSVLDTREITQMFTATTQMLTLLLGAVAAVSLIVGGIGIMNIMLVSVTERTREIGIRLAIGALERDVLLQFLVEAVVLSSLGGVLGIALALLTSIWLADLIQVPFIFQPVIVVVSFFFSAAVGVLFGYFPARKAARLNPIDALRHE